MSVITLATGDVSATIPVGNIPGAVAITPDGKHAYVPNSGDGTVSVITPRRTGVGHHHRAATCPARVAITPDGKHVYVTNPDGHTVSVITTATGDGVRHHPVGNDPRGTWLQLPTASTPT